MSDRRTSHRLGVALRETIRAHARQHHHGAQDVERILSALGEIASAYFAEVPRPSQRRELFNTLCAGIAETTDAKTRDQILAGAPIS